MSESAIPNIDSPLTVWMTVYEVAAYARMTVDAVRGAEKRGQLKAYRTTTGRVRFLKADVDAFLGLPS